MNSIELYSEAGEHEFSVVPGSELDVWDVIDEGALRPDEKKIGWVGRNSKNSYSAWGRFYTQGHLNIGTFDSLLAASCNIVAYDGSIRTHKIPRKLP